MSDGADDPADASLVYLADLHRRIEEQAAQGCWQDVEKLVAERNALLAAFRGVDRPAALRAAQASTDRILALARAARLELAGALADLQRGRRASDAYRAHR